MAEDPQNINKVDLKAQRINDYLNSQILGGKVLTLNDRAYVGDPFKLVPEARVEGKYITPEAVLTEISDKVTNGGEQGKEAREAYEFLKERFYSVLKKQNPDLFNSLGAAVDGLFPTRLSQMTIKANGLKLEPPPGVTTIPAGTQGEV